MHSRHLPSRRLCPLACLSTRTMLALLVAGSPCTPCLHRRLVFPMIRSLEHEVDRGWPNREGHAYPCGARCCAWRGGAWSAAVKRKCMACTGWSSATASRIVLRHNVSAISSTSFIPSTFICISRSSPSSPTHCRMRAPPSSPLSVPPAHTTLFDLTGYLISQREKSTTVFFLLTCVLTVATSSLMTVWCCSWRLQVAGC